MLEVVRKHSQSWLGKLILTVITVPFALWGIDSYLRQAGSNVAVAEVDGHGITVQEYSAALQDFRNRLQASGKKDPALLESPEVRQAVLDRQVLARLMDKEVRHAGVAVGDEQLAKMVLAMPEFQKAGKFSQELYDQVLAQNNLSPSQFEAKMRADMMVQHVKQGVNGGVFIPDSHVLHVMQVEHQQRDISVSQIKAQDFLDKVQIDPAAIKRFYDAHPDKFRAPEQVKLEYLVFSANQLITGLSVDEAEAKKFYEENADKFQGDEERRASHILIGFGNKADANAKAEARKKAEMVLAEVKKDPKQFETLARKYSQDPGSAEKGGDLGVFGRGAMVKPFEEAVFRMTPGSISDIVESEFGYHIIKLTEIKGQSQDYASVRTNIRAELLYQKALAKFAEKAESFSNMVYEQSSSLEPTAQAFGLQVQTTPLLSRAEVNKLMKSDKLTTAIFSADVLKDKRNSEAVEVSPNTLVSARVVEYHASSARPLAEVSTSIEQYLKLEEAQKLAEKRGAELLADLRQGKVDAAKDWSPAVQVERASPQGLTSEVVKHAFKLDASKLPAFDGFAVKGQGYTLVKVSKVESTEQTDEAEKKAFSSELLTAQSTEVMDAYVRSLKAKADIKINQKLLLGSGQ